MCELFGFSSEKEFEINEYLKEYPDSKLYIIGQGPLQGEVEAQIKELGIEDKIVLTGNLMNPFQLMSMCDCFILPSIYEGQPMVLLEAMACGTPVITSNTSSMPEIGGPNAILINPENPDEITDMMIKLETDNDFYSRQEEIGLHQAAMFSWRQTAENLLNLYEEVYREL